MAKRPTEPPIVPPTAPSAAPPRDGSGWLRVALLATCVGASLTVAACSETSHAGGATSAGESSSAGACNLLTPVDVKAITGTDVTRIDRDPAQGAGGTCVNFATLAGDAYLGVHRLGSRREYDASLAAASPRAYPIREMVFGVGEEAMLLTGPASLRFLVARKGDAGVVLFPLGVAPGLSDRALHQLAIRALERLP